MHVSSVIDELAAHHKVEVIRTATSPRQIMEASLKKDVVFVGDCSGGFIFPEFMPAFDAMIAIGKILEMMSKAGTRLNKLAHQVPDFGVVHKRIPCPWDKKGQAMRHALKAAQGKKAELIDGVKLYIDHGWVLLLPDPDEAYFNIWVESDDPHTAREVLKEYSDLVKKWQE